MGKSGEGISSTSLYATLIADNAEVQRRVSALAAAVVDRYKGQNPLFICLLRGGAPFASDLMKAIARHDPQFHPELDYMTIKTYGDERQDHAPQLILDLAPSTQVKDRAVVLLDDTLDKGVTAHFAETHLLNNLQATSVDLIVLVQKELPRTAYGDAILYGFSVPGDAWITGMGLDDTNLAHEGNRWAGFIAVANPED